MLVQDIAGLYIPSHDYVALTYVASGNGAGEIETITYKDGGASGTTQAGAGGSGIVLLRIPNYLTATFTAGLTTSLITSVTGYNVYSVTAGTGTVTFSYV